MSKTLLRKISSIFFNRKLKDLDIHTIEKIIGYRFRNRDLILMAFKHSSFLSVTKEKSYNSNERLEFLGDAVLDLIVTDFLYATMPNTLEGELSKIKSVLVSRSVLAEIIINMQLGKFLLVNRGEEKTGGKSRPSNMANLYEAILGAIYLDGGLKYSRRFIKNTLLDRYEQLINHKNNINYKSMLLEYAQSRGSETPTYRMVSESGPDHEKKFVMNVRLCGKKGARGVGRSKKLAEQAAAHNLIKKIAPELLTANQD